MKATRARYLIAGALAGVAWRSRPYLRAHQGEDALAACLERSATGEVRSCQ